MRIILTLSPNMEFVPFAYYSSILGYVHKVIGENTEHDRTSLYSLGALGKGRVIDKKFLVFPKGTTWEASFYDKDFALRFLSGVHENTHFIYGMKVLKAEIEMTPRFGPNFRFFAASPVLVREYVEDGSNEHLLWNDPKTDALLTKTFRYKLQLAGFTGAHLESFMGFDRSYSRARSKLVSIKGNKMKASECPIIVSGTPEAVRAAYHFGAGHLTGSCFGQLKVSL